jgi:hypothetical protein
LFDNLLATLALPATAAPSSTATRLAWIDGRFRRDPLTERHRITNEGRLIVPTSEVCGS